MYTKKDLKQMGRNIVYMKPVAVADLPQEVRDEAGDMKELFALHNGEGEQLALVASKRIASHLAAEHDMDLVTVH